MTDTPGTDRPAHPDGGEPAVPRTDEENATVIEENATVTHESATMTDTDRLATGATALAVTDAAAPDVATDTTDHPRRRGPDPVALVVGLATLAMAVFAFVGELPDLGFVDPRWLLAGGAATVGLLLLVGTLRGRSGGRRAG